MIGILGSGRYETALEGEQDRTVVSTKFGDVAVLTGMVGGQPAAFIRRFGWEDQLASDVVNHAAHALAFRLLGARRVLTLNGFGGVRPDLHVGDLVVYHDYIRLCERTPTTIFIGEPRWPRANMSEPFCPEMRSALVQSARHHSHRKVYDRGVNICVQGPHNETPAEIEACRRLGADIVCTTIYPEVVYYRELETCYAGLSWVSDIAGGQDEKDWQRVSPNEVVPVVRAAIASLPAMANCRCRHTWEGNEGKLPGWYLELR